jgi:hypothetical protein
MKTVINAWIRPERYMSSPGAIDNLSSTHRGEAVHEGPRSSNQTSLLTYAILVVDFCPPESGFNADPCADPDPQHCLQ